MAGPVTADPLVGRGAVVTWGGRGIGAAIARALSAAGAGVVAAARTSREIEDVASALRARGAKAWAIACDVTVEGSVIDLGRGSGGRGRGEDLARNRGCSVRIARPGSQSLGDRLRRDRRGERDRSRP